MSAQEGTKWSSLFFCLAALCLFGFLFFSINLPPFSNPVSITFGALGVIIFFIGFFLGEKEKSERSQARLDEQNQEREQQKKEKQARIEKMIKDGFSDVQYSLNFVDYTEGFLSIMNNWKKPDFTEILIVGTDTLLERAEKEIEAKLNDYQKVSGLNFIGNSNALGESYQLNMKVGRFNPIDPNLWNLSLLTFSENINSGGEYSSVYWLNNEGTPVMLRRINGRPLKIKERFFKFHANSKSFW